jgi:hypothetical protein
VWGAMGFFRRRAFFPSTQRHTSLCSHGDRENGNWWQLIRVMGWWQESGHRGCGSVMVGCFSEDCQTEHSNSYLEKSFFGVFLCQRPWRMAEEHSLARLGPRPIYRCWYLVIFV